MVDHEAQHTGSLQFFRRRKQRAELTKFTESQIGGSGCRRKCFDMQAHHRAAVTPYDNLNIEIFVSIDAVQGDGHDKGDALVVNAPYGGPDGCPSLGGKCHANFSNPRRNASDYDFLSWSC
ncbi:hypothetical protein D3C87_1626090 [compost metagenome]